MAGGTKRLNDRLQWIGATKFTAGSLANAGTSSLPITTDSASMNFFSYYLQSNATSGDARGIYNRLYISGAGGGGESLRSFTTVENVAGATARGAHISLNFGTTGSITGLGTAASFTLHIPGAMTGGTYAVIQAEVYGDAAGSDITGATEFSFIRFDVSVAAAGLAADVMTGGYLFSIQGLGSAGSGKLFQANTAAAASHALRIKVGSTAYYIMLTDTAA